jgi:hypothetical protein
VQNNILSNEGLLVENRDTYKELPTREGYLYSHRTCRRPHTILILRGKASHSSSEANQIRGRFVLHFAHFPVRIQKAKVPRSIAVISSSQDDMTNLCCASHARPHRECAPMSVAREIPVHFTRLSARTDLDLIRLWNPRVFNLW